MMKKCMNCNITYDSEKKFCIQCGSPLETAAKEKPVPDQQVCPGCRIPIEPGKKFCTHCGTALELEEKKVRPKMTDPIKTNEKPSRTKWIIGTLILIIILGGVIGMGYYQYREYQKGAPIRAREAKFKNLIKRADNINSPEERTQVLKELLKAEKWTERDRPEIRRQIKEAIKKIRETTSP